MSDIQCVIVTPERTEVDVRASAITVPLFDGEMGILKGHSPLVGRMGFGVLRVQVGNETQRYFVEEGLVQVQKDIVSILTDQVTPVSKIDAASANQANEAALQMPSNTPAEVAVRQRAIQRARALSRVSTSQS